MNDLIKPMTPLKCLDKIGFVLDVFKSELSDEMWITFESAESIIRGPIRTKDTEFIPVAPEIVTEITVDDIAKDVVEKKEKIQVAYPKVISDTLEKFKTHDGKFITHEMYGTEPFILHFMNDYRVLLESVMGEILLHFHPQMYKEINREEALGMAEKFVVGIEPAVLDRLDRYLEKVREMAQ